LTLGEYQRLAYATIDEVLERGRLPILVGGTGQYVMAVVEGWGIPEVAPQPRLRKALAGLGGPELGRWLQRLDPQAAVSIDPRNVRRVIRALEVTLVTGRPISELQRKTPPPYAIVIIGLTRGRESLYARIDARVEQMMTNGLLAEVEALRAAGYDRRLPSLSGLGYRQLYDYLEGEITFAEAVERVKFETHRFARQQDTWFRRDDPRITWFDLVHLEDPARAITSFVRNWLA
jgi:tRNA dimethylallyltransferase